MVFIFRGMQGTVCLSWQACRGQKTTWVTLFSAFTIQAPGIELMILGLAADAYTNYAI